MTTDNAVQLYMRLCAGTATPTDLDSYVAWCVTQRLSGVEPAAVVHKMIHNARRLFQERCIKPRKMERWT